MKILVIGGTQFLGRYVVEEALKRGHEITLFNRGKTGPSVFPEVEQIHGDRDGQLDKLAGRTWDAVIDTCGYVPRIVRQSVEFLRERVNHYTFISSISVYGDFSSPQIDESIPVGTVEDETTEEVGKYYGELKALCEREVQSVYGDRALIVRPGLIVGPFDPTDRFTYWVRRFSEGGEALVPGLPQRQIQFIYAHDLAAWTLTMAERSEHGVYNATGPAQTLTMGQFVETLQSVAKNPAKAVWVNEDFLTEREVGEFVELPLWIAEKRGWRGFLNADISKAVQKGLAFRPLADTVRDTLDWDAGRNVMELKAGLKRDKEDMWLKEWANSQA